MINHSSISNRSMDWLKHLQENIYIYMFSFQDHGVFPVFVPIYQSIEHINSPLNHHIFLWFSYGFPMVFLHQHFSRCWMPLVAFIREAWICGSGYRLKYVPFSYGFPMVFPLKPPFSYGFPMVFLKLLL